MKTRVEVDITGAGKEYCEECPERQGAWMGGDGSYLTYCDLLNKPLVGIHGKWERREECLAGEIKESQAPTPVKQHTQSDAADRICEIREGVAEGEKRVLLRVLEMCRDSVPRRTRKCLVEWAEGQLEMLRRV